MDHTVDIVFDFNECTVAGHVADFAVDLAADRILFSQDFPRIAGLLTETEADLLAFFVDVKNNSFHFFANADHITSLGDALGPAHFGDVDQTFDALFDFHKGTVGHDVDHVTLDNAADSVLGFHIVPRIVALLLQTEGDTFLGVVDIQDHHFDFLTDFQHFVRVGDSAPAHIRDVQQAVHTAEIDECTEVRNVLDGALTQLTDFHFLEEGSSAVLAGFFQQFAAGNHDVPAILVDLQDLEIVFLANEIVHVLHRADIDLAAGEERFDAAQVDDDTAFDAMLHETLDDAAFAVFRRNLLPGLDGVRLDEADAGHVTFVFNFFQEHIHFVADLDFFPITEFGSRNFTFRLVTDIDQDRVRTLFNDLAVHDRFGCEFTFGFVFATQKICHGASEAVIHVALQCRCFRRDFFFRRHFLFSFRLSLTCYEKPPSPTRRCEQLLIYSLLPKLQTLFYK